MRLKPKISDRYNIIIGILIVLMGILVIKLSILTIAKGDHYREMADTKRLKEIPITAPRGEIRDRNGKLIAGNKPSFTIQIFKDELDNLDREEKNRQMLRLVRLLEGDGISYRDEFPIQLNVIKYKTNEDYLREELRPKEKALTLILENDLLYEIITSEYENKDYDDHYDFKVVEFIMQSFRNKGIDMPIFVGDNKELYFRDDRDIVQWKLDNKIPESFNPIQSIMKLLESNETIIRKILDHPISRKIVSLLSNNFIIL